MDTAQFVARLSEAASCEQVEALRTQAIAEENRFRELFAQARDDWDVPELDDPYQSLVPAFATLETHPECFEYRDAPSVPLVFEQQLPDWKDGLPAIVDRKTFERQFRLFTEGLLRDMDWSNVFCAGGSIAGCLAPIPPEQNHRVPDQRRYLHDIAFPGSDLDLFIWGLSEEEANKKVGEIYELIAANCPHEVICFRSAYAISIVSQYPFRHVQIVLRLYSSPFEVLAGFDVDSCAVGYDGKDVLMTPRAHLAFVTRTNTIDMTRRSPTYELRLEKYSKRGFQVAVPGLIRERIDPMIYEQEFSTLVGLKRLLVLEKLGTPQARAQYQQMLRVRRGRGLRRALQTRDQWMNARLQDLPGGVEASDYSTVFLPWGPTWNAEKCAQVMRRKERLLNNECANGYRGYPLHPCFAGTAEEVLKDCFPNDGPLPAHADPELVKHHVRGPVSWIKDNPGRQMIGSFNPITEGDWMEGAMLSSHANDLIAAACTGDAAKLEAFLRAQPEAQMSTRDQLGRTALLMSALVGSRDCVKLCLDHGAKLDDSMPDGRNVLHIAAAYGWVEIARLAISAAGESVHAFLRKTDERSLTPLYWAVALGHVAVVRLLVDAGTTATLSPTVSTSNMSHNIHLGVMEQRSQHLHPFLFAMHLLPWSEDLTRNVVKELVRAGAKCTDLSPDRESIVHELAASAQYKHAARFLQIISEEDPSFAEFQHPLITAKNAHGQNALTLAIQADQLELARFLVERGAVVDSLPSPDGQDFMSGGGFGFGGFGGGFGGYYGGFGGPAPNAAAWPALFVRLQQTMSASGQYNVEQQHPLLRLVDFVQFLFERGVDPCTEISVANVGALRMHLPGQQRTITVVQALIMYRDLYGAPQKQSFATQTIDLTQQVTTLQALRRLVDESAAERTYAEFYQHQIAQYWFRRLSHDTAFAAGMSPTDNAQATARHNTTALQGFCDFVDALQKQHKVTAPVNSQPQQRQAMHMQMQMQMQMQPQSATYLGPPRPLEQLVQELRAECQRQAEQQFGRLRDQSVYWGNTQTDSLPSHLQPKYAALFEAAYLGDIDRLRQLCERSSGVPAELLMGVANPLRHTPFSIAVYCDHQHAARMILETAMKQYDAQRIAEQAKQLEGAKQLQTQLQQQAAASGLQNPTRLRAKLDNTMLAASEAYGQDSWQGLTLQSVQQGSSLPAVEESLPVPSSPELLLTTKMMLASLTGLRGKFPPASASDWLDALCEKLCSVENFDVLTQADVRNICDSLVQPLRSAAAVNMLALGPTAVCALRGHNDLCLQLIEWSRELVRQDMAQIYETLNNGEVVQLFRGRHDDMSLAVQMFAPGQLVPYIMSADNVELFERLVREFGACLPFSQLILPFPAAYGRREHYEVALQQTEQLYPLDATPANPDTSVEVKLRLSDGREYFVAVEPSRTVRQLKAAIQHSCGYNAHHQRIFKGEQQLEDDSTVMSYGIEAGCELHVILRRCKLPERGSTDPPQPTIQAPLEGWLREATLAEADKILQCLMTGRATALLEEYLNDDSKQDCLHVKIGRCLRDAVLEQAALDSTAVSAEASPLLLGQALFEDWLTANNAKILADAVCALDVARLERLHSILSPEQWDELINHQMTTAANLMVIATMSLCPPHAPPQQLDRFCQMVEWLYAHGMKLLPDLRQHVSLMSGLRGGAALAATLPTMFSQPARPAFPAKQALPAASAPASTTLQTPQQSGFAASFRATFLLSLFDHVHPRLFEVILKNAPPEDVEQLATAIAATADGQTPIHRLATLSDEYTDNLAYWLAHHVPQTTNVLEVMNQQGETPLHIAVKQQRPLAFTKLAPSAARLPEEVATELGGSSGIAQQSALSAKEPVHEDEQGNTVYDVAIEQCVNGLSTFGQSLRATQYGGRAPSYMELNQEAFAMYLRCLALMRQGARVPTSKQRQVPQTNQTDFEFGGKVGRLGFGAMPKMPVDVGFGALPQMHLALPPIQLRFGFAPNFAMPAPTSEWLQQAFSPEQPPPIFPSQSGPPSQPAQPAAFAFSL